MNQGVAGQLTICILDYSRPAESERCLRSIHQYFTLPREQWKILYLSNGGRQDYVQRWYHDGLIDTLVLDKQNYGCGIGMRQMAAAALTDWVMLIQNDQYVVRPYSATEFTCHISHLIAHPQVLYLDLAGDQGRGRPSERAHLINRRRYLDFPHFDDVIGGPGPFAQQRWTEQHIQETMVAERLVYASVPLLFADNGKWSEREYPVEYGINGIPPRTKHSTDEKKLFILSPFGRRADGFPNLNLTDGEWNCVLDGKWPVEGKIPEQDLAHSFIAWIE